MSLVNWSTWLAGHRYGACFCYICRPFRCCSFQASSMFLAICEPTWHSAPALFHTSLHKLHQAIWRARQHPDISLTSAATAWARSPTWSQRFPPNPHYPITLLKHFPSFTNAFWLSTNAITMNEFRPGTPQNPFQSPVSSKNKSALWCSINPISRCRVPQVTGVDDRMAEKRLAVVEYLQFREVDCKNIYLAKSI